MWGHPPTDHLRNIPTWQPHRAEVLAATTRSKCQPKNVCNDVGMGTVEHLGLKCCLVVLLWVVRFLRKKLKHVESSNINQVFRLLRLSSTRPTKTKPQAAASAQKWPPPWSPHAWAKVVPTGSHWGNGPCLMLSELPCRRNSKFLAYLDLSCLVVGPYLVYPTSNTDHGWSWYILESSGDTLHPKHRQKISILNGDMIQGTRWKLME